MKRRLFALFLAVPILMSGCGGDSDSKKTDSQVAAKVNGEEVTVHQLNQVLGRVRAKVTKENQHEIKQKALESLIDQTLLLQASKQAKLDRYPEILSKLEAAKRKVLVDAYIQRTLKGVGKPSADEINAYYASRPEIFNERRLFIYKQITVPLEKEKLEELTEKLKSTQVVSELVPLLESGGYEYRLVSEAKTSEKLPAPLLKPLVSLKVGDIGYLKMSDGVLIIALEQSIPQPISLNQAGPIIERELYSQKQKEAANKLVQSLKETAVVEFLGEFKPDVKPDMTAE